MVAQQEFDHHRRGELGVPLEPAARGVDVPGQLQERLRLGLPGGQSVRPGAQRTLSKIPRDLHRHVRHLLPPTRPRVMDAFEHLTEGRHALTRPGREVGAEVERFPLRRHEHRHGPAALAGRGLHGLHIDSVHIRTLLTVDLHADEVLVQVRGGALVLEGLLRHDVTPVASAVSHAQENGNITPPSLLEGSGLPRTPVDRVVRMLEEVRGCGVRESVGHALILTHPARRRLHATRRARNGALPEPQPVDRDSIVPRRARPTTQDHLQRKHCNTFYAKLSLRV